MTSFKSYLKAVHFSVQAKNKAEGKPLGAGIALKLSCLKNPLSSHVSRKDPQLGSVSCRTSTCYPLPEAPTPPSIRVSGFFNIG